MVTVTDGREGLPVDTPLESSADLGLFSEAVFLSALQTHVKLLEKGSQAFFPIRETE
jgi:hypothetical protein